MADKLLWFAAGSWAISFLAICAYTAGRKSGERRLGVGDATRGTKENPSGRYRVHFHPTLLRDVVVAAVVSLIPASIGFVLAFLVYT
ncbi:MAG: hypothetical protein KatS3mg119_1994 [Rhodothalassiaceae bacterium]|nr:MAG: hypothetical protein KatS3mg119_1994 [Rhodothalassiaceae bacterium]